MRIGRWVDSDQQVHSLRDLHELSVLITHDGPLQGQAQASRLARFDAPDIGQILCGNAADNNLKCRRSVAVVHF